MNVGEILENLGNSTGFAGFGGDGWKALIMIFIALFFLWLGIKAAVACRYRVRYASYQPSRGRTLPSRNVGG